MNGQAGKMNGTPTRGVATGVFSDNDGVVGAFGTPGSAQKR